MASKRITRSSTRKMLAENPARKPRTCNATAQTISIAKNTAAKPRKSTSIVEITSLNDDCLLEIFSYLSDMDLCAIKTSHQRFHRVADDTFKSKFIPPNNNWYEINGKRDFKEMGDILKNFGHMIIALMMAFDKKDKKCKCKYIPLLKHCHSLRFLQFKHIDFDNLSINPMELKVLRNLYQLCVIQCTGAEKCFKDLLIACNPSKLSSLSLVCPARHAISDDSIAFIADRFVNIKVLFISLNKRTASLAENISKLKNLKNLAKLEINCNKVPLLLSTAIAINKHSSVPEMQLVSKQKIPEKVIQKMTNYEKSSRHECSYTFVRKNQSVD